MAKIYFGEQQVFRDKERRKGRLKIFIGIMPGVGKASAMLRAAQAEAANGRRVVIGVVTWQARPETVNLMDGLEEVPPKIVDYNGIPYKDMDMEAILERHPDVVLATNPAYASLSGNHYRKRCQDILELLDHGIDVFSTLNAVQLESYAEFFKEITGHIPPVVPDEFLAQADDVELVDIEPDELMKRYREGIIFIPGISDKDMESIYREEIIKTIRKRFFQVILDRENWYKQHVKWSSEVRSCILAPIGPDVITSYVIRRAKAMAVTIDADWIALYIETGRKLSEQEKAQLDKNIKLARQLGGTFITWAGTDPVEAFMEVSRRERISHIVLGKNHRGQIAGGSGRKFLKRLLRYSGHINVAIVCGEMNHREKKWLFDINRPDTGKGILVITMVASLVTGILCALLDNKTNTDASPYIVMVLLFMLAAFIRVSSRLILAALAVLAGIIFVLPPSFVFPLQYPSDIVQFLLFSLVALFVGMLTIRIRRQERETFRREKQSNALFLLTKRLSEATDISEMVEASTENLLRYFDIRVFFIFRDDHYQLTNSEYVPDELKLSEKEMEVAAWAFKNDKPAGRITGVMSPAVYTYYPLIGKGQKIGVLVAELEKPFSGKLQISWDAFLAQITQAFEHQHLNMSAHQTSLLNESDRLYKTLFNSISHELRIPISTIMGASDLLLSTIPSEDIRKELYVEMLDSSRRLNRLVENLLNMSRLESGRIAAHPDWCDIRDLFNRVAESLEEELQPFRFDLVVPETMPLVRIDYGLMEQAIYNLVYNATQYTPAGTTIRLGTLYENGFLVIMVTDRGPGFDPGSLNQVFNKFWRPKGEKTGGLGLGLSIVKGFVEAHNGTVFVANRKNGGARFTIMILTEKSDYEAEKTAGTVGEE